jgi:carbonic anhydrase
MRDLTTCKPKGDLLRDALAGNQCFEAARQMAPGPKDAATRQQLFAALVQDESFLDPGALAKGQMHWFALLTCADSHIPAELLFSASDG